MKQLKLEGQPPGEPSRPLASARRDLRKLAELFSAKPRDTVTAEGRSLERYRRIVISSAAGLLARGLSILTGLLLVPLFLSYLGRETYGLWAAITSVTTWVLFFNLGFVDALVNLVSEGHGRDDRKAVEEAVASALYMLLGLACLAGTCLALASRWVRWSSLFAAGGLFPEPVIERAVAAAIAPVLLSLPMSVVRQVYAGYQKAYVASAFEGIGSLLTLGGVFLALRAGASFPITILVYGGGASAAMLANLAYMKFVDMPWISFSPRRVTRCAFRRLTKLALPLFLLQLGALSVNFTQPIILAHRTDLSTVADYSILTRLFGVVGGLILLSTSAFVPAFREAHERGDLAWTKRSFQRMTAVRMAMAVGGAFALTFLGNLALRVWLGPSELEFGRAVWVLAGVNLAASAWGTGFTQLLTIMDRIWVLVGSVMVNGICTVALTIWLAPTYGIAGALVAIGFFTLAAWSWWGPLLSRPMLVEAGSRGVI